VGGLSGSLSTFPNFVAYFVGGSGLTASFVLLYTNLTPYREIALIRAGNTAAAIAFVGALLGFVMPLASVIAHSASLLDVAVWGVVALIVQVGGFLLARLVLPHLPEAIEQGHVADAVFLPGLSAALGLLDAPFMAG
jgi:putative membrane protein